MGEVVKIMTQQQVEDAWDAYQAHVQRAFDDPRLQLDRQWHEDSRRLYRAFSRAFDRTIG